MNVPPGEYDQGMLNAFNEQHKGRYFVNVSETQTHFMTAESTIVMYECLFKDAFRLHRARWKMNAACRGALQCDDSSGNRAENNGHASRREQFSESMNVALPLPKRGGWSAKGSVCDAFHAEYRKLQDHVEDEYLGFNAAISDRTPLQNLQIASNGMVFRQFDPLTRIQVNVDAWKKMPPKVFRWALISRGIHSLESMAKIARMTVEEIDMEIKDAKKLERPFGMDDDCALLPVPAHEVCPT